MAKLNELTGKTFGNWKVLYRNGSTPNKAAIWHCKCLLCGSEHDINGYTLTSGASTKCRACVPRTTLVKPHRKDRIYTIFCGMMQRCHNPNSKGYKSYGGRGITVCAEWYKNPDAFIAWALSNGYQPDLTIERIDLNQGYSPDNCTWISASVQARNKRANAYVIYQGEKQCLSEACRLSGIKYESVRSYKRRHPESSYQAAFDHFACS